MSSSKKRKAAERTLLHIQRTGDQQAIDDAKLALSHHFGSGIEEYLAAHEMELEPRTFIASNGLAFMLCNDGKDGGPNPGTPGWGTALLELIESDREDQLFTWRWPEDENYVVMRNEKPELDQDGHRWVYCWNIEWLEEKSGKSWYCSDHSAPAPGGEFSAHAASHAYFDSVDVPGYQRPVKMRR